MFVYHGPSQQSNKRIQAMEMRCYRKILRSSYKDHVTNEEACAKIHQAIRPHEDLIIIKEMQIAVVWMCLLSSGLDKPSCKAQWKGAEDEADRRKGGKTSQGMDRPWIRQAPEGSGEQRKMEDTGCETICGAPIILAVKG